MTRKTATSWAMVMSAMMLVLMVPLAVQSTTHPISLALPATIVVMTIGVEIRIARALRAAATDERGNDVPALLIQLLLLIPAIGLAGLIAALDGLSRVRP